MKLHRIHEGLGPFNAPEPPRDRDAERREAFEDLVTERAEEMMADGNLIYLACRDTDAEITLNAAIQMAAVYQIIRAEPSREDGDYRALLRELIDETYWQIVWCAAERELNEFGDAA